LLPASSLLGLLLIALTSAPAPAAFTVAFASVTVVFGLLAIGALGPRAVAATRAGMIADLIRVSHAARLWRPDRAPAAAACTR